MKKYHYALKSNYEEAFPHLKTSLSPLAKSIDEALSYLPNSSMYRLVSITKI